VARTVLVRLVSPGIANMLRRSFLRSRFAPVTPAATQRVSLRWLEQRRRSESFHERDRRTGRISPTIWPCTSGFPAPGCRHRSGGSYPNFFTTAKRAGHFERTFPQVYLPMKPCCVRRRSSLVGTFRSAPRGQAFSLCSPCAPWRTRRVAMSRVPPSQS